MASLSPYRDAPPAHLGLQQRSGPAHRPSTTYAIATGLPTVGRKSTLGYPADRFSHHRARNKTAPAADHSPPGPGRRPTRRRARTIRELPENVTQRPGSRLPPLAARAAYSRIDHSSAASTGVVLSSRSIRTGKARLRDAGCPGHPVLPMASRRFLQDRAREASALCGYADLEAIFTRIA